MAGAAPERGRSMGRLRWNELFYEILSLFLLHTVSKKIRCFYVSPRQVEVPLWQTLALNETDHFADKVLCGIHIALLEYVFIENDIYLYIFTVTSFLPLRTDGK